MRSKISDIQRQVLAHMVEGTGRVSAATFNMLCGSPRTVRAMFRDHLVSGDDIPAVYVEVTPKGRAALQSR